MNPWTYGHLIFDKWGKNIYNGENTVFSVSGAGKIEQLYVKDWDQNILNTTHKNKLKMD